MNRNINAVKNRVAIVTNNIECERHSQYYTRVKEYFISNQWHISTDFNDTDVVVICGCGFHNFMFQKISKILHKLRSIDFPEKDIIVLGCSPETHKTELNEIFTGHIIGLHKEYMLDKILNSKVPFTKVKESNLFNSHKNKMFYIKIEDGCLQGCTFCVIKNAKGYIKSSSLDNILKQFKRGVEQGYRKFFLMGEDTFAYGIDIKTDIIKLIKSLSAVEPKAELYFGSLHSQWLKQYSKDINALTQKGIIKKLHIGLQHVNDTLLQKMGRPVAFSDIYEIIQEIKRIYPDLYLSVEVMVGFPGETEEMFQELVHFFKEDTFFNNISHFGYSDLKDAESFNFNEKIDPLQIVRRWDYLKKVLGKRSFYNSTDTPDNYAADFQLTLEKDFFFCQENNNLIGSKQVSFSQP